MLALSVRQPWAWAILHAGKRVENRVWALPQQLIGHRILLHASKGCTRYEYEDGADFIEAVSGLRPPPLDQLPRGAIVGAFNLVGCVAPGEDGGDWHARDQYGFQLDRVAAIAEPVPCSGLLGFWKAPPEVEAEIRRMVA